MRTLLALPLILSLAAPALAQQRQPREPADAQVERCGVRQDSWGAIAPQAERGKRTERAECAKRHLIDWTPSQAAPVQRAK